MKKSWWLYITLKSELCAATGDGIEGLIDSECSHENGIPNIPGKRLKGILLEAGREMAADGLINRKDLDDLFGTAGAADPGKLRVHTACLYRVPKGMLENNTEEITVDDYDSLQEEILGQSELTTRELLDAFTRLRTRTAINEIGAAKKGTLRTIRVVQRGIEFRSRLDLSGVEKDDRLIQILAWCVKSVRHIGMGITRGFGEVSCDLRPIITEEEQSLNQWEEDGLKPEDDVELDYQLILEEPVLLAGKRGLYEDCEDWIPGAPIKGIFASFFVKDHNLGNTAHENPDFRRIFLRDGVQFGYAFLKKGEHVFYPCPSTVVKWKGAPQGKEDIYFNRLYETDETRRRKDVHSLVSFTEDKMWLANTEKEMRMHHSRPKDRGIGHAMGDLADDPQDMGQFYQYVSLKKGQCFTGTMRGKYADICLLRECAEKRNYQIFLGRSRTAEYGRVTFRSQSCKKLKKISQDSQCSRLVLSLVTPMVLYDWTRACALADPELFCRQLKEEWGIQAQLKETFLKFTRISGYNSKWGLPEAQKPALDAGTVLVIETEKPVSCRWFEQQRFGEMTGSGCGMLKAMSFENGRKEYTGKYLEEIKKDRDGTSKLMLAILRDKESKISRSRDRMEALQWYSQDSGSKGKLHSSAVQQLTAMFYADPAGSYDHLAQRISKEVKNKEKQAEMLNFISTCKGKSRDFIEMFLEKAKWEARHYAED